MTMPLHNLNFLKNFGWGPKNTLNGETPPSTSPTSHRLSSEGPSEPPAKRPKPDEEGPVAPKRPKSDEEEPAAPKRLKSDEEEPAASKRPKLDVEEEPVSPKRTKLDVTEATSSFKRPLQAGTEATSNFKRPLPDVIEEVPDSPELGAQRRRQTSFSSATSYRGSYLSSYRGTSILSSGSRVFQSNVNEFRDTERRMGFRGTRRQRRNKDKFYFKSNSAKEPELVQDSDDEQEQVDTIKPPTHKTPAARRHSGWSLEGLKDHHQSSTVRRSHRSPITFQTRSPLHVLKRKSQSEVMGDSKRTRLSSPDPLAGDDPDSEHFPLKTTSASESPRGAIKPTQFKSSTKGKTAASSQRRQENTASDLEKAKRIVNSGLHIRRAADGRFGFPTPGSDPDPVLTLSIHEVSTILLPTNEENTLASSYQYLSVDMKRLQKIRCGDSEDSTIVAIYRNLDVSQSAGRLLYLEFSEPAEREAFVEWVEKLGPGGLSQPKVVRCDATKLRNEMDHNMGPVTRSTVVRDSDPEPAADVKLMQRNRQRQTQSVASSSVKSAKEDRPRSGGKLRDGLRTYSTTSQDQTPTIVPGSPDSSTSGGRVTRARSSKMPERSEVPPEDRWSIQNPRWPENWNQPLVFPPNKTVRDRAVVEAPDIPRLDEGEYLNDSLVWFGLRLLKDRLEKSSPELAQRFHFFNTFFYGNLKPAKTGGSINYNTVKDWTSKVDLFTKDFIIVPICEYSHWYLAIIYNAPKLLPPESKPAGGAAGRDNPKGSPELGEDRAEGKDRVASLRQEANAANTDAAALVETGVRRLSISDSDMDRTSSQKDGIKQSLNAEKRPADARKAEVIDLVDGGASEKTTQPAGKKAHGKKANPVSRKRDPNQPKIITLDSLGLSHSPTCQILRHYLVAELKGKKNVEIPDPGPLGMTARDVPRQENYCDCGLYVIAYVEEFIKDPDLFVRKLLQNEISEWEFSASDLRDELRSVILKLQKEQQDRDELEKEAKQERKKQAALARRNQSQPSSSSEAHQGSSKSASPAAEAVAEAQGKRGHEGKKPEKSGASLPDHIVLEADDNEEVQVVEPEERLDRVSKGQGASSETTTLPDLQPGQEPTLPGAYPQSPIKSARRSTTLTAAGPPEHPSSDATETGFLPPLKSSASRGETPSNPVELDDSQDLTEEVLRKLESERPERPESETTKGSRSRIEIQIPSRRIRGETATESPYFRGDSTSRAGKGTVTAKLVDTPKEVDMVDLSDSD